MSKQNKEEKPELLSDKAIFGQVKAKLAEPEKDFSEMINLDAGEPMPARLRKKIAADAKKYFARQRKND